MQYEATWHKTRPDWVCSQLLELHISLSFVHLDDVAVNLHAQDTAVIPLLDQMRSVIAPLGLHGKTQLNALNLFPMIECKRFSQRWNDISKSYRSMSAVQAVDRIMQQQSQPQVLSRL